MRKLFLVFTAVAIFLTGCSNDSGKDEDTTQEESSNETVVSSFSDDLYSTLFPYEVSDARELITKNMTGRLDVDNFELGLVRLAQETFSIDDYIFQEGQFLNSSTIANWLGRVSEENEDGLNPALPDSGTTEERHNESPRYLAHILEHNYLVEDRDGNYVLGGVVIGLAMNSVHNFNLADEEGGFPREVNISDEELQAQGEEMAAKILPRLRQIEGLEDVPISFMIYKQETSSSLVPGYFVARADVGNGQSIIGGWNKVNEQNYLFPSSAAEENVTSDSSTFNTFISKVGEFFPNYVGIIGRGSYIDGQLRTLNIDIPMTFQSRTDVVGFTQYVASLVTQYFPSYIEVNVYISSTTQQESLVVRESGESEPTIQILR